MGAAAHSGGSGIGNRGSGHSRGSSISGSGDGGSGIGGSGNRGSSHSRGSGIGGRESIKGTHGDTSGIGGGHSRGSCIAVGQGGAISGSIGEAGAVEAIVSLGEESLSGGCGEEGRGDSKELHYDFVAACSTLC